MLTKLKQQIQQMLSAEARVAHKMGFTPNIVTVIGFVLSVSAAVTYGLTSAQQTLWLLVAVVLLMASGFCDTLDGILARTYHQTTRFGGLLDSLLDRYADVLVLAGVIFSGASVLFSSALSFLVQPLAWLWLWLPSQVPSWLAIRERVQKRQASRWSR